MPRTFTEADFADAPATGRVFTDADFAPEEEPSVIAEGAKGVARAGLRLIKGIGGLIVRLPVIDELGQPIEGVTSTGAERAKQIGEAVQPAMESVAEAPGLQDRPWNDPARLASVAGEAAPAMAAIVGSAVASGGAAIPAMVAGGIGGVEQLQRGTEENDPNAGVKAVGAGAFDAATSFLPFHIIGKIASPALKTAAGAGGFTVANPIIAAARALVTGDDPKAAAYESMRNSPVNAVQGGITGRLAPESAAVRGRKIAAGRKAAADKAVLDAAADEAVRTAQELNDWDSAWSEAGRLDHERLLAERRAAKNATLAPAELTGSDAPAQVAMTRAQATEAALADQSPQFQDLTIRPESLGDNPLGQVATDNPITPRIYPNEGKMPELPDMVSSPETSAPRPALPDIEAMQDFPTSGPPVEKVGVEPMLPPGRVRGQRVAPTLIPDLPGKPGLLPTDPVADLPPLAPPPGDLPPKGPNSIPEGKRKFNARRNENGELVIERATETPTLPQEAPLLPEAQGSPAPEIAPPAPAAAAESTPAPTPKQPWEMTRAEFADDEQMRKEFASQYLDEDGNQIASSRTTPAKQSDIPVGTWRLRKESGWNKYGDNIEQLREIPVDKIVPSESTSQDRLPDVDRYAGWMLEGKEAPPFDAAELQDGRFKIGNGHRRLLAAQKAGVKTLKAWVSPMADTGLKDSAGKMIDTDLTHQLAVKQALSEGKPVPPEVLADYPDLAPAPVKPIPATEPQPALDLPPGRKRPVRGGRPLPKIDENLDVFRSNMRSAGIKIPKKKYGAGITKEDLGANISSRYLRSNGAYTWDQALQEAADMGLVPADAGPEALGALLTGRNVGKSDNARMAKADAYLASKMSQDAQDALKLYGDFDTALAKLKQQRDVMAKDKADTTAVEKLIEEFETPKQEDMFSSQEERAAYHAELDELWGPNAGVMNLTAMRQLPGALADLAKKAGRKFARGNDPEGLQPLREARTNALSGMGWELQKHINEYDQAVKSEYKRGERPDIERLANEALQGRSDARDSAEARLQADAAMQKLAPKTRAAVKKARAFLDKTSQQLVDNGIGTDQTLSTVQNNIGIWAKRSYQVFDDPAHIETVEASPKWQEWGEKRAALEAQRGNSVTVEQAKGLNKAMLASMAEEGQGRYLTRTTLGKSDLSSFRQRNEIPLWMREMMGQYADFRVNFTKSAKSNANMIANHAFQEQVHALGDGKFIFDKPTGAAYVQFPESSEYGALAKKFTTPEFRETLRSITTPGGESGVNQLLAATSAVARFNKTAGNFPRGTFRQLPSNLKAGVQAGHITPATFITPAGWRQLATSGKVAWSAVRGRENVNIAQVLNDLYNGGVINSDAVQALQKQSVEAVTGPTSKLGRSRIGRSKAGRMAIEAVKKATDAASDVYMTFDNFQKANGYLAEMDLYRHKVDSGEWTVQQLKDHAIDVVKDVYPTRDRVLRAAEAGRNIPLVADFVFYKSERLRNNVSILNRIGKEINDADPKTRMVGWKRVAGLTAGMVGTPLLIAAANKHNGVDEQEDKAWRDLAGDRLPWLENTTLSFMDHGNGKAKALDIGYMDSDQQITDAVRALIEGKDWKAGLQDATLQFLGEFVGANMAANVVTGILTGVDPETQRPITSKGDEWLQQQLSKVKWAGKKLEPGTVSLGRQMSEVPSGKRSAAEVGLSIVGPATYRLDAAELLKSSAYVFRDTVDAQRTKVNRAKKVDAASAGASRREANENLKIAFRILNEKVKAAGKVGLKRNQIRAVLKDAGFSEGDQTKILSDVWNAKELGIK